MVPPPWRLRPAEARTAAAQTGVQSVEGGCREVWGEVSGEVWDGVGGETGYGTYNAILKMLLFLETAMINMLSISWNLYNSANCAKTHSSENKYIIEQRLHKQL